jgi:hypothetical protein
MWDKVSKRSHNPKQVFPFGRNNDTVMLHGTVDYELKDGRQVQGVEWAARGKLVKNEDRKVKWAFYQVYLDTAGQMQGPPK